ncbi:MAG TPA: efflux transporter outer membrane subunit [Rhizomicrobium sp.]|nr:efflux transporter outer membrane subunit [Rhizomicrobium sp.]
MKRFAVLLLASVSVAACVSAPSTTPSQVEVKSETLGLGAEPTPTISDDWWTAFGDKQLDTLMAQALAGNPSLQVALARMRQAQSELSATRAGTYPQLTGDAQEQRQYFSKSYIIPPPYGGTTQWIGTAQANLSWDLDLFGKQQSEVDKARSSAQAVALDATAARLALAGSVTQAYISLSRAYVLRDVAEDAVKQREDVFNLTSNRVKSGLENKSSSKQSEALLAIEREDLIRAKANVDMAEHEIASLIGRGADIYGHIARPQLKADALSLPETLPADLLARRADIQAARARIDAAMAGREAARKAFYPDINLAAFVGFAAIGLSPMFSAQSLTYGAGPAIHLPIFDAGKLRADYAGATAGLDEAVADYNASVVGAVKQAADAVTQLRSLEDQAGQQRAALAASEDSFRLAQSRYRNGLSPQLNVLDAENVLLQARRQQATIESDLATERVTLLMALGGGFDSQTKISTNQDAGHE